MKVCMALMGLEIGGAETHVLELSLALKAKGVDITVVSNGGVFVRELTAAGIPHVKLPLNRKSPDAFIKSYIGLSKLFKKEKFDIVHAHARIPGFICGLLQKRFKYRFVTTAHWIFKITPLWRLITNWGESSIAVSEDIKQYLIDGYGFFPDNISVTINGIDTKKFSPYAPCDDIKREFRLDDNSISVLHVSRIDSDRSAVSFQLCDAAESVFNSLSKAGDARAACLRFIIVGSGNEFDLLKRKADEINTRCGRELVSLAGARTDINAFIAACNFFVGVSRAALEAMASCRPVILAGNEGYLGIYREELFAKAYDGNFCCRDTVASSAKLISDDLICLLSCDEAELCEIGAYNNKTITEHYSVERMCRDYLTLYETLRPYKHFKYPDVVISGYYGFENMGDDSFLQVMISLLRRIEPDIKIAVLSKKPRKTAKIYGVMAINRFNVLHVYSLLRHSRLLISGGGTLLQDETSRKSLYYYAYIMSLAKKAGAKLMVYANGLGPINHSDSLRRANNALLMADAVTFREASSQLFAQNKMDIRNTIVSVDPAVCIDGCTKKRVELLSKRFGISKDKKYFAVALRTLRRCPDFEARVTAFCNSVIKEFGIYPIFVTMQNRVDERIAKKLYSLTGCSGCIISGITANELVGLLSETVFVVGMRLHVLIYAAAAKKPMLGISYDPKVKAFMDYLSMPYCVEADTFEPEQLIIMSRELLLKLPHLEEMLENKLKTLRPLALNDAKTAISLIKQAEKKALTAEK